MARVTTNPSRTAHADQVNTARVEMESLRGKMAEVEIAAGGTDAAIAQGKTAERVAYTEAYATYGELLRAYVDMYGWDGITQ